MVGYLGNSFLPARAGELLRSAFLGRKTGLGTSFVLATALTERLLDAVALVLLGSVALLSQASMGSLLASALRLVAIAALAGLAVIIIAPFQEALILRLAARLPLPQQISRPLAEQIGRFLTGMRSLHSWRRLGLFVLLTFGIWLVDALGTTIGVRIVWQSLNVAQAMVLLAGLGLSSAVPSTPGYVGVYQFIAVSVLVPFGFSRADALAYILIAQVLNYLVVSFWGLIGLWQINRSAPALDAG
jgi:uncharacterized protein (TIRG00374 family)